MRVMCAWCEKEGVETVIGIIEGPETEVSHGICEQHQEEMLKEIEEIKRKKNPRRRRRKK